MYVKLKLCYLLVTSPEPILHRRKKYACLCNHDRTEFSTEPKLSKMFLDSCILLKNFALCFNIVLVLDSD